MERIWSPWRMAYIQAAKEQGEDGGCIFCDLPAEGDDVRTMILARGELAFVIVNSFPYNPGHLMVAPFRHVGAFTSLEAAELADVDALVARSIRALEQEGIGVASIALHRPTLDDVFLTLTGQRAEREKELSLS